MPAKEVLFNNVIWLIKSLTWFLHLGISQPNQDPTAYEASDYTVHTPLINTLCQFTFLLCKQRHEPNSLATLWDSNPPYSQWSCLYNALCDPNQLLHLFQQHALPVYSQPPIVLAQEDHVRPNVMALVSPYNSSQDNPVEAFSYKERPNIFGAVAQWEEGTKNHYSNKGRLSSMDLTPAPPFAVAGNLNTRPPPPVFNQLPPLAANTRAAARI
jgi:hypothetical protein